jgi:hypothetical protein
MKTLINNEKIVLSTLWIFVLMNMIYADILNTLKPEYLQELEYVGSNISGKTVLILSLFFLTFFFMVIAFSNITLLNKLPPLLIISLLFLYIFIFPVISMRKDVDNLFNILDEKL